MSAANGKTIATRSYLIRPNAGRSAKNRSAPRSSGGIIGPDPNDDPAIFRVAAAKTIYLLIGTFAARS